MTTSFWDLGWIITSVLVGQPNDSLVSSCTHDVPNCPGQIFLLKRGEQLAFCAMVEITFDQKARAKHGQSSWWRSCLTFCWQAAQKVNFDHSAEFGKVKALLLVEGAMLCKTQV